MAPEILASSVLLCRTKRLFQLDKLVLSHPPSYRNCNTQGYVNPDFCIRVADEATGSCRPSVAGPRCCDMPAGKRTNSFVDVSCGDMLQVGGVSSWRGPPRGGGTMRKEGATPAGLEKRATNVCRGGQTLWNCLEEGEPHCLINERSAHRPAMAHCA